MKTIAWVALVIGLGTCSLRAQERAESDASTKVMALEVLWGQAAQIRDIKALESIFDDSLSYVPMDGRLMTKSQVLADTQAAGPLEIVVESTLARSQGNVVIVEGVLRLKGMERGRPYVRYGRFVDTWRSKDGRWLCIASMTTLIAH